jgi:hypothetical protein
MLHNKGRFSLYMMEEIIMSVQTQSASITVFEMSVQSFIRSLEALAGILNKAKVYAEAKKIDTAILFQLRLIPDQFPLAKQIQIACDTAKLFATRLSGVQGPKFEDTEKTFEEFQDRIQQTLAFLKTITPDQLNSFEEKTITFPWRPGQKLDGRSYVLQHAIPNFFFHMTTAYAILRANGVELGKSDYLGAVNWKDV